MTPLKPFLRWAGGKRWLIKKNTPIVPRNFNKYIEPFLGSAAVFFSIPNVDSFILSDINPDLVNCYIALKNDCTSVEKQLQIHQANHSKNYYYQLRNSHPTKPHEQAARFIYLNRTCFNGLYRVNRQGGFNVPIGTRKTVLLDDDNFSEISSKLAQGEILNQDFEATLSMAKKGDFIFIDPPYTVNHNLNGFIAYNEKIFRWEDQVRLKDSVVSAVERGAMITMTNADHQSIRELYSDVCEFEQLERASVIAGDSAHRKVTSEILMRMGWRAEGS